MTALPVLDTSTTAVDVARLSPRGISNAELSAQTASVEHIHRNRLTLCLLTLRSGVTVVGESQSLSGHHDRHVGEALSNLDAREKAMTLLAFARLQGAQ